MTNNIIEIDGKKYQLVEVKEKPKPRKTGYERMVGEVYYCVGMNGFVYEYIDGIDSDGDYNVANYYTDLQLARNNARADALMRNLRRFSAEGVKHKIDKMDINQSKYYLRYGFCCNGRKDIYIDCSYGSITQGAVYFDTKELANAAIEKYRDELMWYFTEYSDTAEVFDE